MNQNKKIQEIADNVASITLELMDDSIDWQLENYSADGDDYDAIHAEVMFHAVEKMYMSTKRRYYELELDYKEITITDR